MFASTDADLVRIPRALPLPGVVTFFAPLPVLIPEPPLTLSGVPKGPAAELLDGSLCCLCAVFSLERTAFSGVLPLLMCLPADDSPAPAVAVATGGAIDCASGTVACTWFTVAVLLMPLYFLLRGALTALTKFAAEAAVASVGSP